MPSCLIEDLSRTLADIAAPLDQDTLAGSQEVMTLVDALTLVPDPRRRQGCRYPFTGLLAVAVVAVLCGARSLAGISRWARGSNAPLLGALGLPRRRPGAGHHDLGAGPVQDRRGRAGRRLDAVHRIPRHRPTRWTRSWTGG